MIHSYICDGIRTPIGRYGGALSGVRTDDLAALPLKALMARHRALDWAQLEEVWYGCVNQAGEDNRNVARMASLLAGLPVTAGAATVNRLCGSGLEALASAARAIQCGPLPATHKLLAQTGLAISDFDVVELNEAFASQALAVLRGLGLADDAEHVNRHGGAIALGHPLGMSGVRLALTAIRQLQRGTGRRALCMMCIGVGQGIAVALERV